MSGYDLSIALHPHSIRGEVVSYPTSAYADDDPPYYRIRMGGATALSDVRGGI